MDCSDVDRAIIQSGKPLPPEIEAHVSGCLRCGKLLLALDTWALSDPPSQATLEDIGRRIAGDLKPVTPFQVNRAVLALAGVFAVALVISRLYPGADGIHAMSVKQLAVTFGVLGVSVMLLADSVVRLLVPGSKHRFSPVLLPVLVMASLGVMAVSLFSFEREFDFWTEWWDCFRLGAPVGLLAAAPFWLVLRRGAILTPAAVGASTGLLAGLVGASILEVRCGNLDAKHILLAHFGVAAAGALVGWAAGYWALRQTQRPALPV